MHECRHQRFEIRRKSCGHIGRQCLDCGRDAFGGRWLKHTDVDNADALPAWQDDAEIAAGPDRLALVGPRDLSTRPKVSTREEYDAYLASDDWRRRRDKVMRRANQMCEGCLSRPAQDVHHLTYRNLYCEFAFELVALCRACHERVHADSANANALAG